MFCEYLNTPVEAVLALLPGNLLGRTRRDKKGGRVGGMGD
jgi:hypothetical protein